MNYGIPLIFELQHESYLIEIIKRKSAQQVETKEVSRKEKDWDGGTSKDHQKLRAWNQLFEVKNLDAGRIFKRSLKIIFWTKILRVVGIAGKNI